MNPIRTLRFLLRVGALAILLSLAGCGGNAVTVQGTVTIDGKPLDGGQIIFTSPLDAAGQRNAIADIKDGKYSLTGDKAPTPGSYRVQILCLRETGKKVPYPGDPGNFTEQKAESVADEFNVKSALTAEVKLGLNTFDYQVKSVAGLRAGR
jgi:hypothetical protein